MTVLAIALIQSPVHEAGIININANWYLTKFDKYFSFFLFLDHPNEVLAREKMATTDEMKDMGKVNEFFF